MDVGFREVTTEQEYIDEKMLPKGLPAEIVASLKEHPPIVAYAKHSKINADGEVVGMVDFDIEERESMVRGNCLILPGLLLTPYGKGNRCLWMNWMHSCTRCCRDVL